MGPVPSLYNFLVLGKGDFAGTSREAREQRRAGREAHEQGQQRHVTTRWRDTGGTRQREAQRFTVYPLGILSIK